MRILLFIICLGAAYGQTVNPGGGGGSSSVGNCQSGSSSPGNCYPSVQTITQSSGTLTGTAASATRDAFNIAQLTANVTAFTLNSLTVGEEIDITCQQAAAAVYTIASPTGFPTIPCSPYPSVYTTSAFIWNGSTATAIAPPATTSLYGSCNEVAAPAGPPPSGQQYSWCDSTSHSFEAEDSSGNIYIIPLNKASRTANQFVTNIAGGVQQVAAIAAADLPVVNTPTPGSSCTFAANSTVCICTTTCSITVPAPVKGYQFCALNSDNVSTVITLSAIGSSAMYENQARTAYGTAGTGTFVSGGAVKDQVCIYGLDSTHYLTINATGVWTAN